MPQRVDPIDRHQRVRPVARELPSNELLASWQHIEQRALDLRAAGLDGTLEELRVRAFLDLLQGCDTRPQPAPAGAPS